MTKDEILKLAQIALENLEHSNFKRRRLDALIAINQALAQPVQEAASIIQAVTDPENQPSQYGTVTLDYHLAKLKEWEDRFEKLSDRALAWPEERNFCQRCGKSTADLTTIHTCTPPRENT